MMQELRWLTTAALVSLASAATPHHSGNCSHEFAPCIDSGCCTNPGFACYKKTTKHFAQCLRKKPDCKDSLEWLCPGWQQCTAPFEDCRHSLCCQETGNRCFRRPHLYWAACRPAQYVSENRPCEDDNEWLCPGWEKCAKPYAECTKSRCCTDSTFGCYLNETLLHDGGGWHAFCQPQPIQPNKTLANLTKARKGMFNQLSGVDILALFQRKNSSLLNQTSWLCEAGASEWACHSRWVSSAKSYFAYADKVAREMESDLAPVTVALIVLGSMAAAVCALTLVMLIVAHHNRVKNRLIQAELELDALRKFAPKDAPPLDTALARERGVGAIPPPDPEVTSAVVVG